MASLRHHAIRLAHAFLICLLLALPCLARAEQIKLDSMKVGSKTYKKITVLGFNATDVYFTHSKGISNAKLKHLDDELKKLFHYDEAAARAAEQQQAAENEEFNKNVVVAIEQSAIAKQTAERRLAMSFEENLSDPISEKSPIGKSAPELKVERWIGAKPDTRDHFQLIYLWAPWSRSSKKFLPDISALQGKFTKEIVFFGLVSEKSPDPETELGMRLEFPTGLDASEKFINALGVTSLPQVVLIDPKGVVRYLGHPAALTEKRLQELVVKFAPTPAS